MSILELQREQQQLKKRIERLEQQFIGVEELLKSSRPDARRKDWRKTIGRFKDDPGFKKIVRLGREYRESQPCPEAEDR